VGREEEKQLFFIVSISQEEINVCSTAFRYQLVNLPKSGLLHLVGHSYCKKSRSAKVKDGIINLFLISDTSAAVLTFIPSRWTVPRQNLTEHHQLHRLLKWPFQHCFYTVTVPD